MRPVRWVLVMCVGTAIACGIAPVSVHAQASSVRGPWIIFGLGGIDEIKGPAIELAGGKEWSIWHVGGRMIAGEELEFDLWGTDTGPNRSIFEIGPVVGAHYTRRPLKIYADVGLCYLSARFRESRPKQSGLGIPCEVGILLAPWHTWGFGLSGYATLNAITNYAGAQFVIRYGR